MRTSFAQFEFSTATGKCGAERRVHGKISLTALLVTYSSLYDGASAVDVSSGFVIEYEGLSGSCGSDRLIEDNFDKAFSG